MGNSQKTRMKKYIYGCCDARREQDIGEFEINRQQSHYTQHEDVLQMTHSITIKKTKKSIINFPTEILQQILKFLQLKEIYVLQCTCKQLNYTISNSFNVYAQQFLNIYFKLEKIDQFLEYGSDQQFNRNIKSLIDFVTEKQDETWKRLCKQFSLLENKWNDYQQCLNKECHFELRSFVVNNLINPSLPTQFMLDETKSIQASSIFQLRLAQNQKPKNNQEFTHYLEHFVEKLKKETIQIIATKKDLIHLQYMLELRWQVLNGCIKDPNPAQIPKQLSLVYWMTYTLNHHCEFVKSFMLSVIDTGNPAWILNTYILFWKRYEGSMSAFDLAFPVLHSLDETFKKLFNGPSQVPLLSNVGIMARIWGQVVLDDQILQIMANSFENLLYFHRKKELENLIETGKFNQTCNFSETIQDFENSERELYQQSHIYTENLYKYEKNGYQSTSEIEDQFFIGQNSELLLQYFFTSMVDVSINEHSINWLGHEQQELQTPFQLMIQKIIASTEELYRQAQIIFSQNVTLLYNYVQSDLMILNKITNKWPCDIYIQPIAQKILNQELRNSIGTPIKLISQGTQDLEEQEVQKNIKSTSEDSEQTEAFEQFVRQVSKSLDLGCFHPSSLSLASTQSSASSSTLKTFTTKLLNEHKELVQIFYDVQKMEKQNQENIKNRNQELLIRNNRLNINMNLPELLKPFYDFRYQHSFLNLSGLFFREESSSSSDSPQDLPVLKLLTQQQANDFQPLNDQEDENETLAQNINKQANL